MRRVVVTGATGRMGRTVIEAAAERDDAEVVAGVSRDPPAEIAGVPTRPAQEFGAVLREYDPDALVDFSAPSSSQNYVAVCGEAGVACVVGTTGFDEQGESVLRSVSDHVPVLKASNFSRGVQALLRAVEGAVADLPGYDVELTETHHNGKRDAPSGTAKTLLDRIASAGGPGERVHGREGDAAREPGEVGVHARRAGGIRGEHEVLLANENEELRLVHRARSRAVFADGALDAAAWVAGKEPGWYDFSEVIAE
ncbi:4-hydroxy-tetrahydrodipicolinate reductase [Haladaptatus salinisoli]|uniref:4-hydroxy-tetrahydrodipicolinate reductase n=1 Tax=Haladaptatus salinisoli TaxID=2884876 RepID=UPI001D0BDBE5|nr:4-hydroxy-tetrahydrodipicolinate reductase [Haladaptatus salinisoli]